MQSAHVNEYLRDAADADVTAKDFRTWMATVMAGTALAGLDAPQSIGRARRETNAVLDAVAGRLRNSRAVTRASYVHPALLAAYADGSLAERWSPVAAASARGLRREERALLGFLRSLQDRTSGLLRAA